MKKQKFCRFALSGVLAAGLALCGAQAFAQDAPDQAGAQGPGGGRRGGMMDPDQALARMAQRYKLSADQQTQIKPILVSQQQQTQALRQDSSMSREDRRTKMESIRADSSSKIEAILNDSQKKDFEKDQQQMQERMQQRMQGGGGGGQGGPPPQ